MSGREISRDDLGQHVLTCAGTFKSIRRVSVILAGLMLFLIFVAMIERVDSAQLWSLVPVLAFLWLAAVAFMLVIIKFIMTVGVFSRGIEGRNFWNFRVRLLWQDITGYRLDKQDGLKAIVLIEKDTGRELWMLEEIAEDKRFQGAVAPFIHWEDLPVLE